MKYEHFVPVNFPLRQMLTSPLSLVDHMQQGVVNEICVMSFDNKQHGSTFTDS